MAVSQTVLKTISVLSFKTKTILSPLFLTTLLIKEFLYGSIFLAFTIPYFLTELSIVSISDEGSESYFLFNILKYENINTKLSKVGAKIKIEE